MHTPSEDEPGTKPLAVARPRPRAENPPSGEAAANADGADANGSNGHNRAPDQASRPQLQGPQPEERRLPFQGSQLEERRPPFQGSQLEERRAPFQGPQVEERRAPFQGTKLKEPPPAAPLPGAQRFKVPRLDRLGSRLPRLSGPWLRRAILIAWPLGLAAAGVVLYLCYLALSRTQEVTSDGASIALQAWDMLHGNPLLRGWTVTDVSFYTTEVPEWAIVEWVRGLNADVLHAAAAITYTLVVLTAGLLGRGQAKGREGAVRLLISAGIVVAPQVTAGVFILIFQPDHIGTSVPLMLTWLVLDRAPRKWYVPPIIAVMLAWGAIADSLILIIAVGPLVVVSAVRAYQILVQRREGWRNGWYDVSLLVAAAAGLEISRIVIRSISAHGGYNVLPVQAGVAPVTDMSAHLWLLVQSLSGIYGADLFGMTSIGLDGAIALLHLLGLALAAWALWLVIRHFFSCEDRIAQLLTVGIVVNLIAYMLSTTPTTYWSAREVSPVLPMGAVLAGRMLGRRLWKARLVPALCVALACYLAALGYGVTTPGIPAVTQNLADWLGQHNLTYGLSSYGIANTTTLASGETVNIRPVSWENTEVAGGPYEFNKSWYDPSQHYANFVILIQPPIPLDEIALWEVKASFGKPAHIYTLGRYTIMVFNKNLLTDLVPTLPPPPPPSLSPSPSSS
jgi:hypothetical protein